MSVLFAAGLVLLALAAAAGLVVTRPRWARGLPYAIGAAGAGCLATAGGDRKSVV